MDQNNQSRVAETDDASLDLSWQAFRYVSGELSAVESAEFEARLVDDEAACMAVADAVRLNEAVFSVFATERVETRHSGDESYSVETRRSSRPVAVVSSLVAVIVVAALFVPRLVNPQAGDVSRSERNRGPRLDAIVEANSLTAAVDEAVADHEDEAEAVAAAEMLRLWADPEQSIVRRPDESSESRPASDESETLIAEVPDWLMVAVQVEAGVFDPESDRVEEN